MGHRRRSSGRSWRKRDLLLVDATNAAVESMWLRIWLMRSFTAWSQGKCALSNGQAGAAGVEAGSVNTRHFNRRGART